MKPPRAFGALPRVRYRPELRQCPHCGAPLAFSHPVWRKPLQSLTGIAHVTSLGCRCPQPACPFGCTVYRSAQAEARQVKGSGYGLDVVVRIGHLRFTEHRTRAEIWRELDQHTPVAISERHVENLLEVYLALLRASRRDVGAQVAATVAATVAAHRGIILAVDGLAPDQDDDQLWVVREVLSGAVLGAAPCRRPPPRRWPPCWARCGRRGCRCWGWSATPRRRCAWRWPTSSWGCPTSCASGTP